MKAAELRELSYQELRVKLDDAKSEAFNLRFQVTSGQLENTARLRTVRREIARILFVMREKELEAKVNG